MNDGTGMYTTCSDIRMHTLPQLCQPSKIQIRIVCNDAGSARARSLLLRRRHNDTGRLRGGQLRQILGVAEKADGVSIR